MAKKQVFNQSIIYFFDLQVQKNPHHMAIEDNDIAYSYKELNEKSNQLAHWFIKKNINPGDFIALLLEPSVDFIVCLLAIIKMGAIYAPLDTSSPASRIEAITSEFNPTLLITDENHKKQLKINANIRFIKKIQFECVNYPKDNLNTVFEGGFPLYLMYTSGSTGKPKGILIPHNAVINLTKIDNYAKIHKDNIIGQFSNPAFDASTFEIWSALLNGATLSILAEDVKKNHIELKKYLKARKISHLFLPTAYFHQLIKSFPNTLNSVESIIFGGEQANATLIKNFLHYRKINKISVTLINGYGPTEATTFTCKHIMTERNEYSDEELMSIGEKITNVKTYILDEKGNQSAVGELYISGINLALGYYPNENSHQNKFSINPYECGKPYQRLYKTGDK